ncbi:MAG: hypothetical protein GEU26_12755 [Nitrososphaeraceae archaeon]|nr:hypothetical protein [Nitrososphaeraceae archaeon]
MKQGNKLIVYAIAVLAITVLLLMQSVNQAVVATKTANEAGFRKAPPAISGDNVYVAWWTNDTANNNEDVIFRASTDSGTSFGDKTNLSNSTDANSTRAEIDSDADSVVVTWWETNQTDDTPVMRVSDDNGATFGPLLQLANNGTIGEEGE